MKRSPLILLILLLGFQMSHGQDKSPANSSPKQSAGKQTVAASVYAANCAGCHGLDGKGSERAPNIATRPKVRQLPDSAILKILQNGIPNTSMPSFKFLDSQTQTAIVAHLRSLQGVTSSQNLPGDVARGKELFFAKGGCGNCHLVQGQGGFYGAELSGYARGHSAAAIGAAIVSSNQDLDPRYRTVVATLATGESLTGIARNEDNFSLQLLTPDGKLHLLYKASLAKLGYLAESPMPADYATKLSASELDDLIKFLVSVAEAQPAQDSRDEFQDN